MARVILDRRWRGRPPGAPTPQTYDRCNCKQVKGDQGSERLRPKHALIRAAISGRFPRG
jgi:hypothetical protein